MVGSRGRSVSVLVRLLVYILAAAGFFLLGGRIDWKGLFSQAGGGAPADTTLILAGSDVAPYLTDELAARYRREYPRVRVEVRGGGTTQALESLANGQANAVLLGRPPTFAEQSIFTAAIRDTAIWYPVALGAVLVVMARGQSDTAVSVPALEALASGKGAEGERLYAPDPNTGLWDAFLTRMGLPATVGPAPRGVVFLKDDAEVVAAVVADPGALGVVSSFTFPRRAVGEGARVVAVQAGPDNPAVLPDNVTVSEGAYPLWSYLYVSCRPGSGIQGNKFVTHFTSARGQRQIENTGYLPARLVPREVYVTRQQVAS